jgi:Lamin Tail Domain/Bacterial Ig-like domain
MELLRERCLAAASTLLLIGFLSAQVNDAFMDGDFASAPAWSGTDALFTVVDDGGNQRLRSNSSGAANYYLSTPSTIANETRWEFFVDLRFGTSGANYVDFYLMSDIADLSGTVNGYFLRMGGTPDRLELFRSDAGSSTTTGLQSPDGVVNSGSSNPFLLRVERTATADWTFWFDDGATGTYALAGTINDAAYTTTTHFGLRIEQSSAGTAVNNHYFDDFAVGPIPVDLTPPALLSATILSATQIDLVFSESVEQTTAEEENNYSIIPFNSAASVVRDVTDLTLVHLTLAIAMQSGNTYTITVDGVEDLLSNACMNETVDVLYFVPDVAAAGDVIINEIMADPDPAVGLPAVEFIEIHNTTTNKTFDLAGWTLTDGNGTGTLPAATLPPGGFAILCDDGNAGLFATFGLAVGFATFPSSLTNTGELLDLKDPDGVTIDAVTYSDDWYNDDIKAGGGWTLERIDPTTPCSSAANWTASNDALGGTPGEQNSVFAIVPDVTAPSLVSVFVNSDTQIELLFSEAMNTASLAAGNYQFSPALSIDLSIPTSDQQVQLTLASALIVGQLYTVTVTGVTDCVGNTIGAANTLTFALPEPVLPGDVVINEVLYDPAGSGSDFVELYNRSGKVLSLAGWKLANETDGVIGNATVITSSAFLLMPGEYALITEDADNIAEQYPLSHTDRFVQADMPSYNNGEGVVVLQDPAGDTLDLFAYNDDQHFALLNSSDGVSLERVSPARPADDNTNWHSAAEHVGYATPGYQNSQYSPSSTIAGELTIERRIFSPDNDGFEDVLNITYLFQAPGFTGTLKVFDVAGREVKTLIDNQLLGTLGTVSWDGIREEGDLARMGPYVVMLEAFDVDGHVERFRETVVVAHKMN